MAAAKKKGLAAHVYINGEHYGPGDDVPAEVAKQITNPKAWGESDSSDDSGDN